jgi:hypothetical protein
MKTLTELRGELSRLKKKRDTLDHRMTHTTDGQKMEVSKITKKAWKMKNNYAEMEKQARLIKYMLA